MLVDLNRTVAFICPMCSRISSKKISVFDFSGDDKVNFICPSPGCHELCATISAKGQKYGINIECPLCGDKHSYNIKRDTFWHKRLIAYKCPAAGMNIFFAGEKREVEKAVDDSANTYQEVMSDWQDIDELGEEDIDNDYSLIYEIVDRIRNLSNAHKLSCRCGSIDIDIGVAAGGIMLQCKRCHRNKVLELSEDTLTRLLNATQIVIGD